MSIPHMVYPLAIAFCCNYPYGIIPITHINPLAQVLFSGNHNVMRTVGFVTVLAAVSGLQLSMVLQMIRDAPYQTISMKLCMVSVGNMYLLGTWIIIVIYRTSKYRRLLETIHWNFPT